MKQLVGEIIGHDEVAIHLSGMDSLTPEHILNDPLRPETSRVVVRDKLPMGPDDGYIHGEIMGESLSITQRERELIQRALDKNEGQRRAAARELGISERTLYRKIKEYGIKG